MKQFKAKIETLINLPVHALRAAVIDAGLMRATRFQVSREARGEGAVTERT